MLALGIPGSGGSAILMTGFLMFGLTPGPLWITRNLPFAYAVVLGNLALAIGLIFIGALAMARIASIIYVPVRFLAPALVVISSAGMFSLRSSVFDVTTAWFFAFLAFILKKYDYPPIAVLIGLILGPMIDAEIYRVDIIYGGNLINLLSRPVVLISLIVGVLLVANPIIRNLVKSRR
jgi:putative tricarboxylic transport membrane protein